MPGSRVRCTEQASRGQTSDRGRRCRGTGSQVWAKRAHVQARAGREEEHDLPKHLCLALGRDADRALVKGSDQLPATKAQEPVIRESPEPDGLHAVEGSRAAGEESPKITQRACPHKRSEQDGQRSPDTKSTRLSLFSPGKQRPSAHPPR